MVLHSKYQTQDETIQQSLQYCGFSEDELAIINALLLGQRQDISKELTANYSKAGAIHILAVSGLHVGVILWMFSFVLKPLERYKRGKNIFKNPTSNAIR